VPGRHLYKKTPGIDICERRAGLHWLAMVDSLAIRRPMVREATPGGPLRWVHRAAWLPRLPVRHVQAETGVVLCTYCIPILDCRVPLSLVRTETGSRAPPVPTVPRGPVPACPRPSGGTVDVHGHAQPGIERCAIAVLWSVNRIEEPARGAAWQ
jgi:hypothetical protein